MWLMCMYVVVDVYVCVCVCCDVFMVDVYVCMCCCLCLGADVAHLNVVHRNFIVPCLSSLFTHGWDAEWKVCACVCVCVRVVCV